MDKKQAKQKADQLESLILLRDAMKRSVALNRDILMDLWKNLAALQALPVRLESSILRYKSMIAATEATRDDAKRILDTINDSINAITGGDHE